MPLIHLTSFSIHKNKHPDHDLTRSLLNQNINQKQINRKNPQKTLNVEDKIFEQFPPKLPQISIIFQIGKLSLEVERKLTFQWYINRNQVAEKLPDWKKKMRAPFSLPPAVIRNHNILVFITGFKFRRKHFFGRFGSFDLGARQLVNGRFRAGAKFSKSREKEN